MPRYLKIGLVACALTLSGATSGCGEDLTLTENGNQPGSPPNICKHIRDARALSVARSSPLGQHEFPFPSTTKIENVSAITGLASAICSLPTASKRLRSCPGDTGVRYALQFLTKNGTVLNVEIDASGCQDVTGAGAVRTAGTSEGFWRALGDAMNMERADIHTFAGRFKP